MLLSDRILAWPIAHPALALLLSVIVTLVAAAGLTRFDMNHDPRAFFGEGNPDFERFKDFEARYGDRDLVMFAIHPRSGTVFTRENLHILEQLTERGWQMPHALRSQSLTNFQFTEVDGDELFTEPLVEEPLMLSDKQLQRIRDIALNEPALLHGAVSPSGHVAAVVVTVTLDAGRRDAPQVAEWATHLQAEFAQRYPDVEFLLTGTVIFNEAMSKATQDGFTEIFPISMLAGILCLLFLLGSGLGTLYTLLIVVLSVVVAIGTSAALGIVFQPLSAYAPAIILTLGIADCLHILVSFYQGLRNGLAKRDAIADSMRVNFQPVVLTSVTTAIGFICLNTSESPPLRDLGNIVAIGVVAALFFSLVLLPALLVLLPAPRVRQENTRSQVWMIALAGFIVRRRYPLLISSSVIMLALTAFIPLNEFNDVWHRYFDKSYPVRVANDFITRELTGLHRIEFSLPAQDEGGVSDPEYLQGLERFKQWAEAQDEVVYTVTYVDVIKRLNRDMNGGDAAFYRVPDSRELAAQYLLMYEMSLPFGLGLDNQVTMGKDQTMFSVVLKPSTSSAVMAFGKRAERWVQQNLPSYMQVKATGLDLLFGSVARRNMMSMLSGTFTALLLISALILVALRSVRYGLLSLLPNILPAAMAFGIWGVINGEIGLSVSIVACITLGIVVDDTIHFLSKYVRAKREKQLPTPDAVMYSLKTVGVALVFTSIILVANFGVLAFASFYPSQSLGILTSVTILVALLVDFFFFVPLLLVLDERFSRRRGRISLVDAALTTDSGPAESPAPDAAGKARGSLPAHEAG